VVGYVTMDVGEIGWGGVTWRTLVNTVMSFWVLLNAVKLTSGYTTGGLSCSAQLQRLVSQ
jgi:hypothetical protein